MSMCILVHLVFDMNKTNRYIVFLGIVANESFLYDIDSVNVLYNSKKYSYANKDSIFRIFYIEQFWVVAFDKNQKEKFGWE